MNKKKVHIITGITSAVLIVAIVAIFFLVRGDKSVAMDYTELYRTDLINSISAKGIVESQDKRNVYSTATATIKTVYIKVGDKVSAGDLLCQLDTEDLRLNLAQQNVEFTAAQQSGLKGQQDNQSNINSAKLDLDTKTTDYNNTKVLYEAGGMSKSELDQAKTAYTQAQNKYQDALRALEEAKTAAGKELERKNIDIQKLEKQIQDASIIAPISGTITAVYAREGAAGSGLLFIIEDTDRLEITTKFREYDIGRVSPGISVVIKTDYTGDSEYSGIIAEVDPTAVKNTNGDTLASTDVEFAAKVAVTSETSNLRIGANANLSVITDKKENVYCVSYDALATAENGETVIYAAQEKGGKYLAHAITVSTGMETDFYVEITGEELVDGMKILKEASAIQNGMTIKLGQEEQI